MTDSTETGVARAFEAQRPRLLAVAGRVLGSASDAEDAVQEAWIRLAGQDPASIDNLAGWLTTVVSRVCIDMLRSRSTRPETLFGDQLPELVLTADPGQSPEHQAMLADSVATALLIVLESLEPTERLAFVLHDLFAVPFAEIARIVGKSTNATKMLASRARQKVRNAGEPEDDRSAQRAVVDRFIGAARDGDFEGLLEVLDPDVISRTHTARGVIVISGADRVAEAARRGGRTPTTAVAVTVNGQPGIVARNRNGKLVGMMACRMKNGRIDRIVALTDPERVRGLRIEDSTSNGLAT